MLRKIVLENSMLCFQVYFLILFREKNGIKKNTKESMFFVVSIFDWINLLLQKKKNKIKDEILKTKSFD